MFGLLHLASRNFTRNKTSVGHRLGLRHWLIQGKSTGRPTFAVLSHTYSAPQDSASLPPRSSLSLATMPAAGDVDKMKVVELRAELVKLGLETKGTKPVLLARLKEALAANAAPEAEVKCEQEDIKSEPGEGETDEPPNPPEITEEAIEQMIMDNEDEMAEEAVDQMIVGNEGNGEEGRKVLESVTLKPTSELMPTEPSEEAQEWQRKYEEVKKARERGADSSNANQG